MKKSQQGNTAAGVIVAIVLLGVGVLLYQQSQKPQGEADKVGSPAFLQDRKTEESTKTGYAGKAISGKSSLYLEFQQADYEKALADGKIIFLDFYANWCPICRAEAPNIESGFNELNQPNVVGFRVNFNDSDTDDNEKALAKKFSIPYQHTKVILKNGQEVFRSQDAWEKDTFLMEIDKVVKGR